MTGLGRSATAVMSTPHPKHSSRTTSLSASCRLITRSDFIIVKEVFAKRGPSHRTQHSDPHPGTVGGALLRASHTRGPPGALEGGSARLALQVRKQTQSCHKHIRTSKSRASQALTAPVNSSLSLPRIQEVFQVPMTIFWKPIVEALTLSWLIRKRPEFFLSLITTTRGWVVKKICNPHWEYIL